MTTAYIGSDDSLANPLDLMEQIASAHDWMFERSSKSDMSLEVVGQWCDYRMFLSWHPEVSALLYVCAYDMRVPDSRWSSVSSFVRTISACANRFASPLATTDSRSAPLRQKRP